MIRKVLFGLFAAGLLSADTINSSTAAFDLTTGSGSSPTGIADGTVSQFNPTLGTLTGITAFISADININAMVDLFGGNSGDAFSGVFSEIPTLANLPGVSLFDTSIEFDVNLGCVTDIFGQCLNSADSDSGTLPGTPMPSSPVPNMNAYIGMAPFPLRWVMLRHSLRFRQTLVTASSTAPKSPETSISSTATPLQVRRFPSRVRSRSWESRCWG